MNVFTCVMVLVGWAFVRATPVMDYEASRETSMVKQNYRPSHFTQPIYKATVMDDNKIGFMDNPIIIDNVNDEMYFVITSDNYEDYSIHINDSNNTDHKQIQLELISTRPSLKEFDIIILEALDEDLVPVSRTTVLLFNSNNMEYDMYKMTFTIDNEEYIILNFYYFKWFLGLLTITGALIFVIEIHEILKNIRIARNSGKYQELQNI